VSVATLALTLSTETSTPLSTTDTVTDDGTVTRTVAVGGTVGGFLGGISLIAGIAALTWYYRFTRRRRMRSPSSDEGKLVRTS
jgi:hypothetical protein